MAPTVDEIVQRYEEGSAKIRARANTPAKARAFLVKAGILEKDPKSASGVRLAKRFR